MPLTRRHFLAAAPALPFAWRGLAQSGPRTRDAHWVFLGTDKGKGIYRCAWNPATGTLGKPTLAAETDRPDFLALHPTQAVLYTANSMSGAQAGVSAYRMERGSGELTLINRLGTHSDGPCFVSVDRTGHAAYAANYAGGSVSAYRLGSRGELAELVGVLAYKQPQHGPVSDRQDAAHLHCTTLSPDNRFVTVCDLGDDLILVFPVAPEQGASIQAPLRFNARPGSGPRHVAFHPNGRWLYCAHELDASLDLYDWSVTGGSPSLTLRPDSVVSTLGPGDPPPSNAQPEPTAPSTGCELIVSDDGRFLTACTRGADTIVTFRIDARTGLLTRQQRFPCGGKIPRLIAFDPSRRWLLAMNQGSSNVSVFAQDAATGHVNPAFRSFAADTPMCAVWT